MAKTVNYTPEMEARMVELYNPVRAQDEATRDAVVKRIATELKKNERSVRAKLSRMQIYVAKTPVSKVTGETPAKKLELANRLVEVSGANVNPENVAKMNKVDIVRLIEKFEALNAREEVDQDDLIEDLDPEISEPTD